MPISLNITQPTGVTASYHKVTGGGYGQNSVTATVLSFLDNQHTDEQGFAPLASSTIMVSSILAVPAVTPAAGTTFGSVFASGLDQFLVAQQMPNPLSTTAVPLPPINGPFYGGTVVP